MTAPDLMALITADEQVAILEKMVQFTARPVGHLPKEDELYLEQQLTDWFGVEVAAECEGRRLGHSLGVMAAVPHLRRYPEDTLPSHQVHLEAGFAPHRSSFGWFTEMGQLTPTAISREQYFFAVQAELVSSWQGSDWRSWLKYRKMIMINPAEQRAVVGVVADTGPSSWMQEQFGGSPEVVRDGKVWSPKAQGKVFLFFVQDPQEKLALGPVDLRSISL